MRSGKVGGKVGEFCWENNTCIMPAPVAILVASRYALPIYGESVIGESGFQAQAGRVIVSGYSGVCFML